MNPALPTLLALLPYRLEYLTVAQLLLVFAILGIVVVLMGMRSMAGLGPVRKWVAIALRLLVIFFFLLIIGGLRWQEIQKDVETLLVVDRSESVRKLYHGFPGDKYNKAIAEYLKGVSSAADKKPDDRIGLIAFSDSASIESIPDKTPRQDARPVEEEGRGTDISSGIQLALATFSHDAMRRIVLISDGNNNIGDLDAAVAAAASQHVPIDVMPLHYNIDHEVMLEHFAAPSWKSEKEPFSVDVFLRSTNKVPVTGKLSVRMIDSDGLPVSVHFDPRHPEADYKVITVQPGANRETITIPALEAAGVYRFEASFEGAGTDVTLTENKQAKAFTFVRGKGKILYVDNATDPQTQKMGPGEALQNALKAEGIEMQRKSIDDFNQLDLISLQNYDAVVLANAPHGSYGILPDKANELASYVHDMGGGLVMIGGPNSFGAGGWQAADKFRDILPVEMEIPAQREIPKGALVMVMHSCEMPDGNYWGEQCALKAAATLSSRDEIGVISYGWNNGAGGIGGAQWDFPLAEKGDGTAVTSAIKKMQLGDMPSFDDCLTLAIKGAHAGAPCLLNSDARQRHIIIISDGDPAAPGGDLYAICQQKGISISTITIYPHNVDQSGVAPVMAEMAQKTKGRFYGPIISNFNQLPQIFIKEATVVRRSLIVEDLKKGIPVKLVPQEASDLVKGITAFPPINGMVLTARKDRTAQNDVRVPLVVGKNNDPLLAHWQTGLGRVVVFTSDATTLWAANWVGSPAFGKFWAQAIRSVARPPMSSDFDVRTSVDGGKGKIVVDALNKDTGFLNFLNMGGNVVGPNGPMPIRLVQTGPGTYEGEFDASGPGNYVALLSYSGKNGSGSLLTGTTINTDPELHDLTSNDAKLRNIAEQTKGRMLDPFNAESAHLFSRDGLTQGSSPMPVWDTLVPILLALILFDVAVRRIAIDGATVARAMKASADFVRSFTTTRKVESAPTLDALRRVRGEVAETRFKQTDAGEAGQPKPDPKAKFEAKGVAGDITSVVGGATDKAIPPPPKKIEPKGAPTGPGGGYTSSLLEAKRRAQEQIRQKEQQDKDKPKQQ